MAEKIVGECQVFLNLKSSTFRADYFILLFLLGENHATPLSFRINVFLAEAE